MDKEGVFGLARNNGGAGLAAGLPAGTGIEGEISFELLGISRVALVAVLDEERADVGFEILDTFGFIRTCRAAGKYHHQKNEALCWW